MKDEELDEYKKMAEKFIAKADEEKEVESERADEAEANIAELKIQISSLNMATDLKNVEINRLQTAYNQLYLETNSVPNEAINDKVRRRAQRE
uniref:Uncharacterized protein n=1 Tax=Panagrolaimus sp. ES5 TaxID=591445 RepID=A0AC34G685_9BILA